MLASSVQITLRGQFPEFSPDRYMRMYIIHLRELFEGAVQAFLRRVVTADAIRIDTGMSRSSLLPLARAVRALTDVQSSIIPLRAPRKGLTLMTRSYVANRFKGPDEGEKAGKNAYELVFGSPKDPVFRFRFRIRVFQWDFHEDRWNALDKGREAFNEYIRGNHRPPPLSAGFLSGRKL